MLNNFSGHQPTHRLSLECHSCSKLIRGLCVDDVQELFGVVPEVDAERLQVIISL